MYVKVMNQFLLILLVLLISTSVAFSKSEEQAAECASEAKGPCHNKQLALKYSYIAIGTILVASIIGVSLPLFAPAVPAFQPDRSPFLLVRSFASGVIVATGFMHVMPDSWNDLTSPCLPEKPWQQYPFTPFVTMLSAYGTMMMDSFSMAYYEKKNKSKLSNHNHNHNLVDEPKVVITNGDDQNVVPNESKEITKGHCNHSKIMQVVGDLEKSKLLKDRVVAQVLELGIVVHSVVIGLSMGASDNPCTIRPLIAAMCFHQLFEGMGLGGCILQAEFGFKIKAIMVFFFSLTTPFGIVLGLLLQNVYNENSPIALIVVGVLNAISAGLLIYMAMVDLLAADFKGPKLQANMKLQLLCYLVALLGTGIMSLMAKWA